MWEGELAGDDVDADVVLECCCTDLPVAPASSVKASYFGGDFDRAEAGDAITRVRNEEAEEAAGVIVAPLQACYSGVSVCRQASIARWTLSIPRRKSAVPSFGRLPTL